MGLTPECFDLAEQGFAGSPTRLVLLGSLTTRNLIFPPLLTNRIPTAGLSASHVCADWVHGCSLAAKWARLLLTYQAAAYLTNQRSKYSEGLGVGVVAYSGLMH